MSNTDLRRFAGDLFHAWAKAGEDVDGFMAFFTEDVRVSLMVREGLIPGVPTHYDKAGWRAQAIAESEVSKLVLDIQHVIGDANGMAIEAIGNLEVAGHAYQNKYCFIADLSGAQISGFRVYLDTLYAVEAVKWLLDADQRVPGDVQ